jgi:signal transduction histidine kinase/CheY-like chemotaxis protein
MSFDADRVARQFWAFTLSAMLIGTMSFLGGLAIIWLPLRRWLQPLHAGAMAPNAGDAALAQEVDPATIAAAPQEFRRTLEALSMTAARLRAELNEREAVLQRLRSIFATLEPGVQVPGDSAGLGELVSSLSNLVQEREAIRRELARAVEDSDAANRAKSAFLATMSHELRTPLNGILGMAQLLHLGEVDDATRREYSGVIHASGITLLGLLNDILDLSKIESGKAELAEAEFSPAALLAEAATVFAASAASKGVALRVAPLSMRHATYWGDAARLRQMLSNLASNAIKFTAKGSVTLACAELPAGWMEFSVTDTGCGIAPEQVVRLFQRFSQLDDSLARRAGGSGLGLSIVKGFAELMGGEAGVTSRTGEGSRFWFRVPAHLPPATRSVPAPALAPALEERIVSRLRGRVLVVDDSSANRIVANRLLERLGLAIESVGSGAEAVAGALADPPPDLILMDLQMPGMDGTEATVAIRREELARGRRRTPIVALTAAAYASDEKRCRAAGMDGHISKPILLRTLSQELAKWLPTDGAL